MYVHSILKWPSLLSSLACSCSLPNNTLNKPDFISFFEMGLEQSVLVHRQLWNLWSRMFSSKDVKNLHIFWITDVSGRFWTFGSLSYSHYVAVTLYEMYASTVHVTHQLIRSVMSFMRERTSCVCISNEVGNSGNFDHILHLLRDLVWHTLLT